MNTTSIHPDAQAVLDFWFVETKPSQHYKKDPAFDATIKERFESLYWQIVDQKTDAWRTTPEGRLAEILVLDQFARNIFRDDKQSFAADELALSRAQEAVSLGLDTKLPEHQRSFLYMPYMHSESKEVHGKAVELFSSLSNQITLKYEFKHKEIIDTFGRYPHRNAVLGRTSTPEERAFLEEHSGF